MNKNYLFFAILVCIIVGIAFVSYYSWNPCYKPAKERVGLSVAHHNDDTIRIAFIGDSWVYRHQSVICILDSLLSAYTGKTVLIRHAGVGGLVSKEIYYSIFSNSVFKNIIEWGPDYCYISAGINDTNKKIGSINFSENMRLLISLLLKNGIVPIIQEIPYYDINYALLHMRPVDMFRSLRSMLWTWSSINCIDDYSMSFNKMIEENHWQNQVIIIHRDSWNPKGYQGQKDLYVEDRMHINQKGYFILDSCIASQIVLFLRNKDVFSTRGSSVQ